MEPLFQPLAAAGRQLNNLDTGIDSARILDTACNIEVHMGKQIAFIQQQQSAGTKHIRVFQWLVFAFGHRKHQYLGILPQIKTCRTDQVADVFDKQQIHGCTTQFVTGLTHRLCIQVTAFTGSDLCGLYTGSANAVRILFRLLVSFDDGHPHLSLQRINGASQQCCLTRPGTRHQIEYGTAGLSPSRSVVFGKVIVMRHQVRFQCDQASCRLVLARA